jgi:hypothetical protein
VVVGLVPHLVSIQFVGSGIGVITAVGVLLTGIGTILNRQDTKAIHRQVKTKNGTTLGQYAEDSNDRLRKAANDAPTDTGSTRSVG